MKLVMKNHEEGKTRRSFMKDAVKYGAGFAAMASLKALGANDRIRIGVMGAGGRAGELMNCLLPEHPEFWAGMPQFRIRTVPGTEIVAVADVYEPNLERAAARVGPAT